MKTKKILVFSEHEEFIKKFALTMVMYQVYGVTRISSIIKQVQACDPDIILMDDSVIIQDFNFIKELSAHPLTQNIPLILLTARKDLKLTIENIGIHTTLTKPLDSDNLNRFNETISAILS